MASVDWPSPISGLAHFINRRHKKPRSFDQGLCYRIKVARGFLCASRRSVGLEADMAQRTGLEPATPGVTGRYSNRLNYRCVSLDQLRVNPTTVLKHLIDQPWLFNLKPDESNLENMAQRTGLEPATPGVTGRYSNRLNYRCASVQPLTLRLARRQNSQEVVGDDGIEPPTLCL